MSTSSWPTDWNDRKVGIDCGMCATRGLDDNGRGLRVLKGEYADVYLNPAALRGYAVAIWNGPHVAEPTQLTEDEAAGFFREVLRAGRAIEQHLHPAKMNYEVQGNSVPHLHVHVIPRPDDDPAPGAQLPSAFLEHQPDISPQFAQDLAYLRRVLS
ncbi:HIT family protein [Kitasatospora purpeofusca]|uniref:HIT family protein n=1 Tax=Kitasatospora purpeofusca TaxID=67352 RepID=UPI0036B1F15B